MTRAVEDLNRRMLRARDAMDRTYSQPLDIPALAQVAHVSEAHFIRTFRATFGETPHRYLQRRRVERAMFLLIDSPASITDVCLDVGFTSLGTFSRTFRDIVGMNPSDYRDSGTAIAAPTCFVMAWMRPSSLGAPPKSEHQRDQAGEGSEQRTHGQRGEHVIADPEAPSPKRHEGKRQGAGRDQQNGAQSDRVHGQVVPPTTPAVDRPARQLARHQK